MAPDSSISSLEAIPLTHPQPLSPSEKGEKPRFKFRARFRKAGDLRLVSHHDLMHVVERMFRRADLELCITQGFNPRPKMAFALSLALGVAGLNEVLEFEAAQSIAAEEVERRLTRQCPPGLEIVGVSAIDAKKSASVRRALYRLSLEPCWEGEAPAEPGVSEAQGSAGASPSQPSDPCAAFFQRTECWVERPRPKPRRINIRPFVHELAIRENYLEMALWITPNGAARPDEVIKALGLGDLLDAGAVIERTDLELYDELPPDVEKAPTIQAAFAEITANDRETPTTSRPTAIIDNPMSFET